MHRINNVLYVALLINFMLLICSCGGEKRQEIQEKQDYKMSMRMDLPSSFKLLSEEDIEELGLNKFYNSKYYLDSVNNWIIFMKKDTSDYTKDKFENEVEQKKQKLIEWEERESVEWVWLKSSKENVNGHTWVIMKYLVESDTSFNNVFKFEAITRYRNRRFMIAFESPLNESDEYSTIDSSFEKIFHTLELN